MYHVHQTQNTSIRFVLPGLMLAVVLGCGGGAPYDLIPVSGKVTYDDGSLIPAGRITVTFIPQVSPVDEKTYPRASVAEVNVADGTFSKMTTWQFGDGVILGRHEVEVICYGDEDNPTSPIPKSYRNADLSPPRVEVGPDSIFFEFTIKKE